MSYLMRIHKETQPTRPQVCSIFTMKSSRMPRSFPDIRKVGAELVVLESIIRELNNYVAIKNFLYR